MQFYYLFILFIFCGLHFVVAAKRDLGLFFCCCLSPRTNSSLSLPPPSYTHSKPRWEVTPRWCTPRHAQLPQPHPLPSTPSVPSSNQISLDNPCRWVCLSDSHVSFWLPFTSPFLSCRFPLASCNHCSSPLPALASLLRRSSHRVSRVSNGICPISHLVLVLLHVILSS